MAAKRDRGVTAPGEGAFGTEATQAARALVGFCDYRGDRNPMSNNNKATLAVAGGRLVAAAGGWVRGSQLVYFPTVQFYGLPSAPSRTRVKKFLRGP